MGSVVTRLVTFNEQNNTVTFFLEPNMPGDTIHQYFAVDAQRRVVVVKNLTGLVSWGWSVLPSYLCKSTLPSLKVWLLRDETY